MAKIVPCHFPSTVSSALSERCGGVQVPGAWGWQLCAGGSSIVAAGDARGMMQMWKSFQNPGKSASPSRPGEPGEFCTTHIASIRLQKRLGRQIPFGGKAIWPEEYCVHKPPTAPKERLPHTCGVLSPVIPGLDGHDGGEVADDALKTGDNRVDTSGEVDVVTRPRDCGLLFQNVSASVEYYIAGVVSKRQEPVGAGLGSFPTETPQSEHGAPGPGSAICKQTQPSSGAARPDSSNPTSPSSARVQASLPYLHKRQQVCVGQTALSITNTGFHPGTSTIDRAARELVFKRSSVVDIIHLGTGDQNPPADGK
ncbi:hypothetical protein Bbelb_184640 [Branchiostoma belcheri]|nr:hypothetical protein Bbelb_184640 [Branchiostoma belcheri]